MRGKVIFFLLLVFFISINNVIAQNNAPADTVSLSLNDAEALFLKNNFYLLAARYQIGEADAAVIQARLWDNPSLSIDKEAYNKPSNRWFAVPNTGEFALNFQQLIYLAGKRNKRINIERTNSQISQYQFFDLIRTLRYELRTTFIELYFSQQSLSVYDHEIAALKALTDAYAEEYQKGNVPFKELARLQALLFSLENEKIDLIKSLNEKQNDLLLLTGDTLARQIKPVFESTLSDKIDPSSFTLSKLIEDGLKNRNDLKIAEAQIKSEEISLSLQKAMRVPDLTIGASFDRLGGYIPDYNSITLGIDLPVWNRNQGNIKMSQNKVEERKVLRNQKELEVKSDITKAWVEFVESDRLYRSSFQKFDSSYDRLFDGITVAYRNHTISLLEFIDYCETYKNSKNQYFQLQINRLEAIENLAMSTGTPIN